jgi:hypothetical protein
MKTRDKFQARNERPTRVNKVNNNDETNMKSKKIFLYLFVEWTKNEFENNSKNI